MTGVRTAETIRQKHVIRVDFFMIRIDPSPILFYFYFFIRSESVRVDPSWSDPDWRSELIRSNFCSCLPKMFVCPVPKISQVTMKWCRRASHLGRFTLWNNGRRATQLSRFTLWHNRRWDSQLAGKFTLWDTTDAELNNPVWCMHQE